MNNLCKTYRHFLFRETTNAPLVVFRILFGLLLTFSTARFMYLGWIEDHFINPVLHFKYAGFGWVEVLSPSAMYAMHIIMLVTAIAITLGAFYKIAAALFFLAFTYCELVDITYYLNHYYFVSLVSFWMIFLPANRRFSIDLLISRGKIYTTTTPFWTIGILMFHIALVYVFAGIAKINTDWLIHALPLKIWLPAKDYLPVIGFIFKYDWTPYVFSWAGMLYDLTIIFFLLYRRTRPWAYTAVIIFHMITWMLFQIGIFPWVMIGCTILFFGKNWHEKVLQGLEKTFRFPVFQKVSSYRFATNPAIGVILSIYILFQVLFPFRYLLYPGNLYWTEEGYRFSWRVMLVEKAGTATFYVKDKATGRTGIVNNAEFLNPHQEKQMSFQPDLILQFAHYLRDHYAKQGLMEPEVKAEIWVTMNARPSKLMIDTTVNLSLIKDSWAPKTWILPY